MKVGYVVKMYPRFSETFILNEILELEKLGAGLRIFSLKYPNDGRFHAELARVRAPVTYLPNTLAEQFGLAGDANLKLLKERPRKYLKALGHAVRQRKPVYAVKRLMQAAKVVVEAEEEGIRHLHAHFATSAARVAFYASMLSGMTFSFTAHAKDIYQEDKDVEHLREKLRAARLCVTVSEYNKRHLKGVCPEARVERVYNGIDLSRFSPGDAGTKDEPPVILSVGRLVEKKGIPDLVEACRILKERGVRFRCLIVGKGGQERSVREKVGELGLWDVIEMPGPLPQGQLLGLYRRAAVFAAPCVVAGNGNRDGLPTAILEAMASGVPVVSTPVTGIPEAVVNGETGLLVPEHDPDALAAALELLSDPILRAKMGARARRRAEEVFDLSRNAGRLYRIFAEATGEPDTAETAAGLRGNTVGTTAGARS
jgi:glycosyltransferase involved in cell wall biosynthesis